MMFPEEAAPPALSYSSHSEMDRPTTNPIPILPIFVHLFTVFKGLLYQTEQCAPLFKAVNNNNETETVLFCANPVGEEG